MTLIPTFLGSTSASKVVELEKLHRSDRFPEWAESIFSGSYIAEKVWQDENYGFRAIFALDERDAHLGSSRHRWQSCRACKCT